MKVSIPNKLEGTSGFRSGVVEPFRIKGGKLNKKQVSQIESIITEAQAKDSDQGDSYAFSQIVKVLS